MDSAVQLSYNQPLDTRVKKIFNKYLPLPLGVLAMDCVNEILSKNCVPAEFEEFLLRLFQQTYHLLQRITKDSGLQTTGHKLLELDERSGN